MSNFRDYKLEEDKEYITIELEEYKELLIIKGKYEQLASSIPTYTYPKITWRGDTGFKEIDPGFYTAGFCQVNDRAECEVREG